MTQTYSSLRYITYCGAVVVIESRRWTLSASKGARAKAALPMRRRSRILCFIRVPWVTTDMSPGVPRIVLGVERIPSRGLCCPSCDRLVRVETCLLYRTDGVFLTSKSRNTI